MYCAPAIFKAQSHTVEPREKWSAYLRAALTTKGTNHTVHCAHGKRWSAKDGGSSDQRGSTVFPLKAQAQTLGTGP